MSLQEQIDSLRSKVSEMAREYENQECSGIDIEMAKKVLQEEDKFDRERFRERVKEKHREEKRKLKEKNKKKKQTEDEDDDEDEEEPMGSDGEDQNSEMSDSDGPDLSWLPDPDKIYGPKASSNDEASESEEEIPKIHKPSKRKLVTQEKEKKKNKKQKIKVTERSDLLATEELALQLLRS